MSSSDEDVLQFIASSFPSVWALELLLTLRRERRHWTREELVTTLRASELVVSKALDALEAAGLALVEKGGAVYLPLSPALDECIALTEQFYRSRPNAVRRAIVATSTSSATAFANAFRLRGGNND